MAHITDLGFTMEELEAAKAAGDIRTQVHPEFPELIIANYSENTQFRGKWNKITLACRGLILDSDGAVIARPWEKFFNMGQMDNRIESNAPVEVTDKMDGSLGILYFDPSIRSMAIATRGSFASEQAIHATKLLNERYKPFVDFMILEPYCDNYTVLFEIIYPDNRIVVNYGQMDDLVLLGAVDKARGDYIGPLESKGMFLWDGPVTQVWKYDHFVDALSAPDRYGKEGYVIRSGRNIVKLKQADYVELHRIVTNLSPKTIWEMMGNGKTAEDIATGLPDEFHPYITKIADQLNFEASTQKFKATIAFDKIRADLIGKYGEFNRGQFARIATTYGDLAKYLFLLLDGKDITTAVWASIRPRGDIKSLVSDEG